MIPEGSFSSAGKPSVAGVERIHCNAAVKLHLWLGPVDDIPSEVAAAGGQAVDVSGAQGVRPHVQVWHLSHVRLGGIKTTS